MLTSLQVPCPECHYKLGTKICVHLIKASAFNVRVLENFADMLNCQECSLFPLHSTWLYPHLSRVIQANLERNISSKLPSYFLKEWGCIWKSICIHKHRKSVKENTIIHTSNLRIHTGVQEWGVRNYDLKTSLLPELLQWDFIIFLQAYKLCYLTRKSLGINFSNFFSFY